MESQSPFSSPPEVPAAACHSEGLCLFVNFHLQFVNLLKKSSIGFLIVVENVLKMGVS